MNTTVEKLYKSALSTEDNNIRVPKLLEAAEVAKKYGLENQALFIRVERPWA